MLARIYRPAKTSMQSGKAKARQWILEFEPEAAKRPDPLMGWSGSGDTRSQIRMKFATETDAVAYAKRNNLAYQVIEPHVPAQKIRSYAENFR